MAAVIASSAARQALIDNNDVWNTPENADLMAATLNASADLFTVARDTYTTNAADNTGTTYRYYGLDASNVWHNTDVTAPLPDGQPLIMFVSQIGANGASVTGPYGNYHVVGGNNILAKSAPGPWIYSDAQASNYRHMIIGQGAINGPANYIRLTLKAWKVTS
jgi:hypothetical protein